MDDSKYFENSQSDVKFDAEYEFLPETETGRGNGAGRGGE